MTGTRVVVVMGVTGTGKTTIGVLLAARFGVPYAEGDDLHSRANVAKMSSGVPLTDEDRGPWLDAIGAWARDRAGAGGVISGSALRRAYRDRVRAAAPGIVFVHLTGDRALIASRLARRQGHFMPTELLASQLAALQPLEPDEAGVTVDVSGTPEETTDRVVEALRELEGPSVVR
ncbi:gluconokinase [Streptomyces sp. NPDC055058]